MRSIPRIAVLLLGGSLATGQAGKSEQPNLIGVLADDANGGWARGGAGGPGLGSPATTAGARGGCEGTIDGSVYLLAGARRCDPWRWSGAFWGNSGGVARCSLNPRLIAGIPLGWRMAGGVVAGDSDSFWRGIPGSVSPATTEVARGFAGVSESDYDGGFSGKTFWVCEVIVIFGKVGHVLVSKL